MNPWTSRWALMPPALPFPAQWGSSTQSPTEALPQSTRENGPGVHRHSCYESPGGAHDSVLESGVQVLSWVWNLLICK